MRDKVEQSQPENCCDTPKTFACRERTSREWLLQLIEDKEREIAELRSLANAMPNEMPHQAERAMRNLIQRSMIRQ